MLSDSNIYPVITLYQPWASFIIEGYKTIETRLHDRFKNLKGHNILIHAGKKFDKDHYSIESKSYYDYGCILGKVYVYDFQALDEKHSLDALIDCENVKRYGLFLKNIEKFDEPIYNVKGSMGIWYYDLENRIKVKKGD